MLRTTSIPGVLDSFSDLWSPRLVAAVNDHHIKVAKIDGTFIWHTHPDTEEVFYLLSGALTMEIEGSDPVVMKQGDVFVVPKGVKHRPVASNAAIMLVERADTVNTGDEPESELTAQVEDARE
jgi:mannose-6-phosphate isomerase-like protein (cupin superfamily)